MADAISRKIEIGTQDWSSLTCSRTIYFAMLRHYCNKGHVFLVAISLHLYADSPDFEVRSQTVVGVYTILFGIDIQPFTKCESLDMQLSSSDEFVQY